MSNDTTLEKVITFFVKPYGIDWFDEIVNRDAIIIKAASTIDLATLDKRLDELELQYKVSRT